jgi:hypothetical protein
MKKEFTAWLKREWLYDRTEDRQRKRDHKVYKKKEKSILKLFNQFAGKDVPTAKVSQNVVKAFGKAYAVEGVEFHDIFKDPTIQAVDKLAKANNLTLTFLEYGLRFDMGGHNPNRLNVQLQGMPDKTVRIKKFSMSNNY